MVPDEVYPNSPLRGVVFEIPAGGRTMKLKRPVALRVGLDEGTWFVENEALSLFGHGRSIEEAVAEFIHDLGYVWAATARWAMTS
jgi:hypothetical protein